MLGWKSLQSATQHNFSQVPRADIPRSQFNRSHRLKTAFDSGKLIPILLDEVLPGDTFNLRTSLFARLSTPIVPVMDNIYLDTFYFFIPNRLVWTNWHKFLGAQDNPGDSVSYLIPTITINSGTGIASESLADYFGLPILKDDISFSALPFRAYNLVWNEWFRDQNLIGDAVVDKDDGPDTYGDYVLMRRGKRHDYFTSCLPWAQKGDAVEVPLGSTAPVMGIGTANQVFSTSGQNVYEADGTTGTYTYSRLINPASGDNTTFVQGTAATGGYPSVYADLSTATASTINALRLAFQVQRLYERDARGGTRINEIILAHFGVVSPDARLQRPEFLGGSSCPINVHPIPQTSATGATGTPQGNLSAMATAAHTDRGFVKSFTEHGMILGLACVRADLSYQQGLHRSWSRSVKTDFYWPALSQIGEQAVLTQEIYCDTPGAGTNDDVFGYQERYAEYRYKPSQITGKLRSDASSSLEVWHLAQDFASAPTLGQTFIEETPPISRVVAVNTEPQIILDALFDMKCARPMPIYGVPGNIDRF